jgi:quercetin dioxygenase-like cupin family protein
VAAAATSVAALGLTLPSGSAQQPGVRRTDLQRHDLSSPGREVVQVRVELDSGVAFGRHRHPGEEIIYVLEGTFEYEVEGRGVLTLRAGEVLFVPAGTVHAARNVGRGKAAELATYIVEKGKPLLEPAK